MQFAEMEIPEERQDACSLRFLLLLLWLLFWGRRSSARFTAVLDIISEEPTGCQVKEKFWRHLYLRVWNSREALKPSEETQRQGQKPEETLRGWRESKELMEDVEEGAERKHREYDITEAKGREHFKEKHSQQVKYG